MAVEVVGDVAVHAALDAALRPRLQHRSPVRVVQARGVLAHLADAVLLRCHRRAVGVPRDQVERVFHRLRAEFLLVPQFAVELEEPSRTVLAFGFADQERDVEVADDLRAALVDRGVAVRRTTRRTPSAPAPGSGPGSPCTPACAPGCRSARRRSRPGTRPASRPRRTSGSRRRAYSAQWAIRRVNSVRFGAGGSAAGSVPAASNPSMSAAKEVARMCFSSWESRRMHYGSRNSRREQAAVGDCVSRARRDNRFTPRRVLLKPGVVASGAASARRCSPAQPAG